MEPRVLDQHATRFFIGRTQELELLRAQLAAAIAGRGSVVLLAGDPGIGKTRTTEEFARLAEAAGAEVLVGRCYEGEGAPAFWPWVQILRAYAAARDDGTLAAELDGFAADVATIHPGLRVRLPDLPPPPALSPDQARFRIFEGVTAALGAAAGRRPIVLLLDDLHGADQPSLLLLQFLARTLREARILVVAAMREPALAPGHLVAETLGELVREQVVAPVRLRGLDEAEVESMLGHLAGGAVPPGVAAAVHSRTEGNPLYVMEVGRALLAEGLPTGEALGRALRADLPESVRLAIGRRLAPISADCRELLTVAALFGREFRVQTLARASGVDAGRVLALLDEAIEARVVALAQSDPGRVVFAHALIFETLVQALGFAARAELHCRIAAALAADPRPDEHAAEIAHHWFSAGPAGNPEEAVAWASRAAERALALLAYEEAVRLYRLALAALEWTSACDEAHETELWLALGEACKRAGDQDEAQRIFGRAADLARRRGSAELLTQAALGFAPPIAYGNQAMPEPRVVDLLDDAIASWRGRDSGLHARALARLAATLLFGDRARQTVLCDQAMDMARRVGDEAAIRDVIATWFATYQRRFDLDLRLRLATELVELAERSGHLETLAIGRSWRSIHLLELDDAFGMRTEIRAFIELARELRQPFWRWHAEVAEFSLAYFEGRFADCERASAAGIALAREQMGQMAYAASIYWAAQRMLVGVYAGDPRAGAADYEAAVEMHPALLAISPIAWMACELGEIDKARAIVERLTADDFALVMDDGLYLIGLTFLSEACVRLDDRARLARLEELLLPHAAEWTVWAEGICLGPVALQLGMIARGLGRLDDAVRRLDAAVSKAAIARAWPFLARCQHETAATLRLRGGPGDAARADTLDGEARVIAARLGMVPFRTAMPEAGASSSRGPAEIASPAVSRPTGRQVFRRDGEYWTITYAGKTIRLRNIRGIEYLSQLLAAPGRERHVTEMIGTNGSDASAAASADATRVARDLGDAGPLLDATARAAYRARLQDLREELAEAERQHDLGRVERAQEETAALLNQLEAAGRGRVAASHAERARQTVTKRIKEALERIARAHPDLGAHLGATVRRGYFCVYLPDPERPLDWEM